MTVEDCASSCSGLNGSFMACYTCYHYYDCRLESYYTIYTWVCVYIYIYNCLFS